MEKEQIELTVPRIPISERGRVARDGEIWEQQDGGAYFMVVRHSPENFPKSIEMISLSVSGVPSERARVIREFSEVLGAPAEIDDNPSDLERVDIASWIQRVSERVS